MRFSVLVLVLGLSSYGQRAYADHAVQVPFDPPPGDPVLKGKCVKWSNGLVGTTCSYCVNADDGSCGLFRTNIEDDFGSATHALRGATPTFGVCHAVGDDQLCDLEVDNGTLRCRYSKTRAACYFVGTVDKRPAAEWIHAASGTTVSTTPPPPAPAPSLGGPTTTIPFSQSPSGWVESCVRWSNLQGTACSFCMNENDSSCRMCREGFGSATCSVGKRGEAPTFGTCKADGDDQVCDYQDQHCRYSNDRAACYSHNIDDSNREDANWINSRQIVTTSEPGASRARCIVHPGSLDGRACVAPAADGAHGRLCFYSSASTDPLECLDVASATEDPTFGDCSGPDDNRVCTISNVRCRYWGGPSPNTRCYAKGKSTVDASWIDDGRPSLDAKSSSHSHRDSSRWPNTVYVGVELGMARPGAEDYYANGNGRAFMVGAMGFEMRLFEGYDLPDPKMTYKNVAGTSNAFVISSLAYRYLLGHGGPVSLSVLGGLAVMHRSLFGTSGEQIPGFEDFPEVQWQFGVGAMLGGGLVLGGIAYVDVRAYPASWGAIGIGDNAAAPGGVPITGNAGVRIGF